MKNTIIIATLVATVSCTCTKKFVTHEQEQASDVVALATTGDVGNASDNLRQDVGTHDTPEPHPVRMDVGIPDVNDDIEIIDIPTCTDPAVEAVYDVIDPRFDAASTDESKRDYVGLTFKRLFCDGGRTRYTFDAQGLERDVLGKLVVYFDGRAKLTSDVFVDHTTCQTPAARSSQPWKLQLELTQPRHDMKPITELDEAEAYQSDDVTNGWRYWFVANGSFVKPNEDAGIVLFVNRPSDGSSGFQVGPWANNVTADIGASTKLYYDFTDQKGKTRVGTATLSVNLVESCRSGG